MVTVDIDQVQFNYQRQPRPYRVNLFFCKGLSLFVACLCFLVVTVSAPSRAASLVTPPPLPEVAPIIHETFAGDADGDRIDDTLADQVTANEAAGMVGAASVASAKRIGVELIFREPVTQDQIDAFLGLGGEITYMYRAVSYGWNGRIDVTRLPALPAVMGPSLVQVVGVPQIEWHMDIASQTGRVRPIWTPGFAGNVEGFRGDPNTTIAFIDTGVDGQHLDLADRCAYWNYLGESSEDGPIDWYGHGTAVAGVALGTGQSAGNTDTRLEFTCSVPYPAYSCVVEPITLPAGTYCFTSEAFWDGVPAMVDQVFWDKGSSPDAISYVGDYAFGWPPQYLSNTFVSDGKSCYSCYLVDPYDVGMADIIVTNKISDYPCVGDGFNTFSGVAPLCRWAVEAIPDDVDFDNFGNLLAAGLDDLVARRIDNSIKIINLSVGLVDEEGIALASVPFRDKINSAVRNGVIVVVAGGNSAGAEHEDERAFGDPERAALAICVGASSDGNLLTEYSSHGFLDPQAGEGEDFKPDLVAPGGSFYYSGIMTVDSSYSDGTSVDMQWNDYLNTMGTSLSSPFVAGCAALVIEALERNGVEWDFGSDWYPRFVKMLLCATASETNADRESGRLNPTLQRAAAGPEGFPAGKDRFEGYGLINADAAVEAVCQSYVPGTVATDAFGDEPGDRRVWARTVDLIGGANIALFLQNPTEADYDLYLYSTVPSDTGTPVILASSTADQLGGEEVIQYTPAEDITALVVAKRVSGTGAFELMSVPAGPPVARDVTVVGSADGPVPVALRAVDDGLPNPPGQLSYTIASLPEHGQLEQIDGTPITSVPMTLDEGAREVVYVSDAGWVGSDSFSYYACDGGQEPQGGTSNTAWVNIEIEGEVTVSYQVAAGDDDASAAIWGTSQNVDDPYLSLGYHMAGMRFCAVDIPQGAQIVSAVLKVMSYKSGLTVDIDTPIYAEAADDAVAFDSSHRVNARERTAAKVTWKIVDSWERNTWYESPDLASVIQEVVSRPGWSANNAMVIICYVDNGASTDRKFWSYDGDPTGAPVLEITYQP